MHITKSANSQRNFDDYTFGIWCGRAVTPMKRLVRSPAPVGVLPIATFKRFAAARPYHTGT